MWLQSLGVGCPNDPIVEAVASSLPESAATTGLPTLRQLQQQFGGVATAAAEAVYFTAEGEGGVLARAAAKLAVMLKVWLAGEEHNHLLTLVFCSNRRFNMKTFEIIACLTDTRQLY